MLLPWIIAILAEFFIPPALAVGQEPVFKWFIDKEKTLHCKKYRKSDRKFDQGEITSFSSCYLIKITHAEKGQYITFGDVTLCRSDIRAIESLLVTSFDSFYDSFPALQNFSNPKKEDCNPSIIESFNEKSVHKILSHTKLSSRNKKDIQYCKEKNESYDNLEKTLENHFKNKTGDPTNSSDILRNEDAGIFFKFVRNDLDVQNTFLNKLKTKELLIELIEESNHIITLFNDISLYDNLEKDIENEEKKDALKKLYNLYGDKNQVGKWDIKMAKNIIPKLIPILKSEESSIKKSIEIRESLISINKLQEKITLLQGKIIDHSIDLIENSPSMRTHISHISYITENLMKNHESTAEYQEDHRKNYAHTLATNVFMLRYVIPPLYLSLRNTSALQKEIPKKDQESFGEKIQLSKWTIENLMEKVNQNLNDVANQMRKPGNSSNEELSNGNAVGFSELTSINGLLDTLKKALHQHQQSNNEANDF